VEVRCARTYRERVEALLASRVPDFISQNAILQAALLSEESSANGWLFVGLELVVDLQAQRQEMSNGTMKPRGMATHESQYNRGLSDGSLACWAIKSE